jgi:hypothetical protein
MLLKNEMAAITKKAAKLLPSLLWLKPGWNLIYPNYKLGLDHPALTE